MPSTHKKVQAWHPSSLTPILEVEKSRSLDGDKQVPWVYWLATLTHPRSFR